MTAQLPEHRTSAFPVRLPAQEPIAVVRRSFVAICGGNHCAAVVLNQLCYWTGRQRNQEGWIYKGQQDLSDEIVGLYRAQTIAKAITEVLIARGFIEQRNNPLHRWDRRLQYRVNVAAVQAAVDTLQDETMRAITEDTPSSKGGSTSPSSMIEKSSMEARRSEDRRANNRRAISETTPETTPQTPSSSAARSANGKTPIAAVSNRRVREQSATISESGAPSKVIAVGNGEGVKVSSTAIALSPADLLAQHRVPWEGASTPMDHVIAYAHALGIAATISDDPLKGQALRHLKGLTKIGATPDEIYACTRWLTDTWAANARRNNSEPVTPTPSQVAANFTRFRAAKPKVAPPVAKPTPVEAFPKPGREGRYCVSFWNAVFGDQNPLDEDILALLLARRQDPARDGYVVRGTANPPLSDRIEITDFAFQPEGWTYDPEEYARVVALAADKK